MLIKGLRLHGVTRWYKGSLRLNAKPNLGGSKLYYTVKPVGNP